MEYCLGRYAWTGKFAIAYRDKASKMEMLLLTHYPPIPVGSLEHETAIKYRLISSRFVFFKHNSLIPNFNDAAYIETPIGNN